MVVATADPGPRRQRPGSSFSVFFTVFVRTLFGNSRIQHSLAQAKARSFSTRVADVQEEREAVALGKREGFPSCGPSVALSSVSRTGSRGFEPSVKVRHFALLQRSSVPRGVSDHTSNHAPKAPRQALLHFHTKSRRRLAAFGRVLRVRGTLILGSTVLNPNTPTLASANGLNLSFKPGSTKVQPIARDWDPLC